MEKPIIGIVFAMHREARPLLDLLGLTRAEEVYRNGLFYKGRRVVAAVTGEGTLSACLCTAILIERFGCNLIFNAGSCGSTGASLPVGTVVSVDKVYKGDVDLTVAGFSPFELPDTPIILHPEYDPALPAASARSADRFIGKNDAVESDIVVEMEAFPVAYVCHRMGVPCRVYKVVSDMTAENEDSAQFSGNLDAVSNALAGHLYTIIRGRLGQ